MRFSRFPALVALLAACASSPRGPDLVAREARMALRAYAAAQLLAFEHYRGWFFWSYRTETTPGWCFRDCVARGWLPARFQ